MQYDICGVSLVSDEPLPELAPSTSSKSEISLCLRRESRITAAGEITRPAAEWTLPDGRPFLNSFKTKNGYLLRFVDLADFFIDQAASEIVYAARPGVPANSVRHLILDSVIALVLSLRGRAVFHASAIVTPYGACAFAAASGTGKSTLAASFQPLGYQTLTDDCLLLDDGGCLYGIPSYPGARLRKDSLSLVGGDHGDTISVAHYNSKRRMAAGRFASERHILRAIYCLDRPAGEDEQLGEPRVEALSGHDSLLNALRHLFCVDAHDPSFLVRQFRMLESMLSRIPILRLSIPNDFDALPRVHQAVLADLRARSGSGLPLSL